MIVSLLNAASPYANHKSRPYSWALLKHLCIGIPSYVASLLVSPLVLGVIDEPVNLLDRTGTQWSPYLEWSMKNPTYSGNPYDLIATAAFVHSTSGKSHTTEMFYDGDNTWKFRFTGTQTGKWTFITSSSDGDLNGHSGTVIIKPNLNTNMHGFVTKFGNKWGWQGTNEAFVPQLVMYKDPNKYYNQPDMVDADIQTFLVEHGFNGFHTQVWNRWFHIDNERNNYSTVSNPDPRTFEALELLITKTHSAGGLVHIWMWGAALPSDRHTGPKGGVNGVIEKRLQRYIAARLGPIPGWTIGYGYDLDKWVTAAQLKEWRDYFHDHFGWAHFVGGRAGGPNSGLDHSEYIAWNASLDFSSYEHHRPSYEVYVAAMRAVPGQPAFSEDRFRIRLGSPFGNKDYTAGSTRRGLWHSTLAGGVANIWGNMVDPDTGKNAYINGPSFPYPNPELIKTYAKFFKNRFMQDMERDENITDGLSLKCSTNTHYIFYKDSTDTIQMDLSGMNGAQPAVAVDTRKNYTEINLGLLRPANKTWTAPYSSDWAIAVGDYRMSTIQHIRQTEQ